MPPEEIVCDCCAAVLRHRSAVNGVPALRCPACGYEKYVPEISSQQHDVYEADADYAADTYAAPDDLWRWCHSYARAYVQSHGANGKSLLDVGCGNGFFVARMKSLGLRAQGVDFNELAIAHGRQAFGLTEAEISGRSLRELTALPGRFDFITLFDVLEHLPRPRETLLELRELLAPGGVAIVAVPNANAIWRPPADFPPHHLSRFTPAALRAILQGVDLRVERLDEEMNVSQLARNAAGALFRKPGGASLRGGEFRRPGLANRLKAVANRMKGATEALLTPIDAVMRVAGARYLSQCAVAVRT